MIKQVTSTEAFEMMGQKQEAESDTAVIGTLTHTGRLGETMKESVEVVKIAVFNFLKKKFGESSTFD